MKGFSLSRRILDLAQRGLVEPGTVVRTVYQNPCQNPTETRSAVALRIKATLTHFSISCLTSPPRSIAVVRTSMPKDFTIIPQSPVSDVFAVPHTSDPSQIRSRPIPKNMANIKSEKNIVLNVSTADLCGG